MMTCDQKLGHLMQVMKVTEQDGNESEENDDNHKERMKRDKTPSTLPLPRPSLLLPCFLPFCLSALTAGEVSPF